MHLHTSMNEISIKKIKGTYDELDYLDKTKNFIPLNKYGLVVIQVTIFIFILSKNLHSQKIKFVVKNTRICHN